MKKIYLLTDYNDRFGSKYGAKPYRSGMDKKLLKRHFREHDYEAIFLKISSAQELKEVKGVPILYTSTEDPGYRYKSFIEDVVLYLQNRGANVIPRHEFLRANNNKSFMELYRKTFKNGSINSLKSLSFGSLEELEYNISHFKYPVVVKESAGAMSKGVYLAKNKVQLIKIARKISSAKHLLNDIKDFIRSYIHKNYKKQSRYRQKFIVQEYIPRLNFDYKVIVFGDHYYIFKRPTRKNDFRASGSGNENYIYGSSVKYPKGIFDFSKRIFETMNLPHISLDIAYDSECSKFYLIEFQGIYFGTVGYLKSDGYYLLQKKEWTFKSEKPSIEHEYVESVVTFLQF